MDDLAVSASRRDGYVTITIVNLSPDKEAKLMIRPVGSRIAGNARMTIVS